VTAAESALRMSKVRWPPVRHLDSSRSNVLDIRKLNLRKLYQLRETMWQDPAITCRP